ncbi:MAG TPA: hypothetical protein VNL70_11420 [Tepidisphaeraceae bacterium]|nr:hypothetical protein [Tepidisphaeraceae bacterium]
MSNVRRFPLFTTALSSLGLCIAAAPLHAAVTVYPDSVGDQAGGPETDISSVEVSSDASTISFKINLTGNIDNPGVNDWGNYHIGFDVAPGGKTTPGVGWGNPFGIGSGMDFWVGSWVNFGGGAELHQYTGDGTSNSWGPTIPGTSVTLGPNSTTITIPLSAMGLGDGSVVVFDAWSTFGAPGGQGAYDASSNPVLAVTQPWNGTPYDAGNNVSVYVVPEPAAVTMLMGMSGAMLLAGRRRS